MMRRFNVYVLWEVIKVFVVALIAFTTLIMLAMVGQKLVSQGLGPQAILDLLPYVLPLSLPYALPATLLFAVCSVYGRISADNEILSVMAAGVPPIRIITPSLILSFFVSLAAVWFNDIAFSWGEPGINRVAMHSIEEVAYSILSNQRSYSAQGLSIHVQAIGEDGRELISPTITFNPKTGDKQMIITARSGRLKMDPEREILRLELLDSEVDYDGHVQTLPGHFSHEVPLAHAMKKGGTSGHPTEYAMNEIAHEVLRQRLDIERSQEILAARTAMGLAAGQFSWLNDPQAVHHLGTVRSGNDRLCRLHIEPWRRWSSGFCCLFFVWFGIPLAILMRTADHWTSFGICFMPILLLYFPFFFIALDNAKDGAWPPMSVWLGNVVLLVAGAVCLRKIYRT